ncbi:MAG TPA: histidine kinase dimerization/phospho-acceptor domain-containing protein, partial [Chitinophagaceae bacterium]|nr:histidine kinase dimerization/phospho-acceptor domain-containing protein [Chitinophagaceae bacterium]
MNQRANKRSVTKLRNYSSSAARAELPPEVVIEKDQVMYVPTIAHEVRNPLANIDLAVGILQSLVTDDEQRLYLDIVLRASGRINNLVNDLLLQHNHALVKPE